MCKNSKIFIILKRWYGVGKVVTQGYYYK